MIGLARIGGIVACTGLAVLLVAVAPRVRLGGLGVAAVGAALLGLELAPSGPRTIAVGAAVALAAGALVAALLRRMPWALPLLALACVPVRIGTHVGGGNTKLLLPLYVVVIGAAIDLALTLARNRVHTRELGIATLPIAAYLVWTGSSLAWGIDLGEGATEVLAFYLPFAILALAIARLPWSEGATRILYVEAVAMALAFVAVGFFQYTTRDIFQNPKVIYANAYAPFFRVNSVFWDPSVYGRFLVVSMVPSIVLVALGRGGRLAFGALAVIVVTWLGLLTSFSQSSFAALLVVVTGAAAVAWRARAIAAVAVAVAVLAGMAAADPPLRQSVQRHTTTALNDATSRRYGLVANGLRIARAHPVLGVGVGGFKRAYAQRLHLRAQEPKSGASHTTPVTVVAETGVVGLGLFLWLVAALFVEAYRAARRSPAARLALVAGLALAGIVCHSVFYNDLFEDPTTWGLIGLVGLARRRQELPCTSS